MAVDLSSAAIGSIWRDNYGIAWKLCYIGRDRAVLVRRAYSSIHKADGEFIKNAIEHLFTLVALHDGRPGDQPALITIVSAEPESAQSVS